MNFHRLLISIRLVLTPGASRRAEYLRRKKVFHEMGENCLIMKRKLPLYPELISFGNNVRIASNVSFLTHDISHQVLNNMNLFSGYKFPEKIGCIKIGNNVFVGAGTRILYDIKIGSNVIIATGSVITHDIPDNSIVAGVPGRVIGNFNDYVEKRRLEAEKNTMLEQPSRESVSKKLESIMWQEFNQNHS